MYRSLTSGAGRGGAGRGGAGRLQESLAYGNYSDASALHPHRQLLPQSPCRSTEALPHGTGLSDATDWIAQDLLQSMLNLSPATDFLSIASSSAKRYLAIYDDVYKSPLERHRKPDTPSPNLNDLVGEYIMENLDKATVEVSFDPVNKGGLLMMICRQDDQVWKLWHYHDDVFCFLPDSYDACLKQGYAAASAEYFLVPFTRDQNGAINGLRDDVMMIRDASNRRRKLFRIPSLYYLDGSSRRFAFRTHFPFSIAHALVQQTGETMIPDFGWHKESKERVGYIANRTQHKMSDHIKWHWRISELQFDTLVRQGGTNM
ncbi:uncharacterized protein MYCFIDRAFT_176317 [Pseudocercospora fijiensis CIRAD86]|uniref:Uncharacterized protein n=1 Tax=Pseudocercospora fijiensis (strain CIRAD86) TaxID=383855 RepID=M2YT95_PSEFD|nr:uncharacterized protein MYCFIDRAFT_176317 [Pseudocercospora fijiensis CIRAD86]EME80970.1 hypothetical protein MYCFIDRAFT_176317 [Pseudocercospora fijiensis CIRAD86]